MRRFFFSAVGKERVRQIEHEAIEFIRKSILADEGMESLPNLGDSSFGQDLRNTTFAPVTMVAQLASVLAVPLDGVVQVFSPRNFSG